MFLQIWLLSRKTVALVVLQIGVIPVRGKEKNNNKNLRHAMSSKVVELVMGHLPQQLIHPAPEGEEHEDVEHQPLGDVHGHPTKRDLARRRHYYFNVTLLKREEKKKKRLLYLQRPQVRVDGEDVDELEEGGDHPGAEQTLGDQVGVVGVPPLPFHMCGKGKKRTMAGYTKKKNILGRVESPLTLDSRD